MSGESINPGSNVRRRFPASAPINEWLDIPAPRLRALHHLGLESLGDLLRHYPRRYEDRTQRAQFPDGPSDVPVCLVGNVAATSIKRFGYRRSAYEVTLENASGSAFCQPVVLRWFNMPYLQKSIATGHSLAVFGKPKLRGRQVIFDHPEYEVLDDLDGPADSIHLGRIVPIHPAGEGASSRWIRSLVASALEVWDGHEGGLLPASSGGATPRAFQQIHFPGSDAAREEAARTLGLDEAFGLQIVVQYRKRSWGQRTGKSRRAAGKLLDRLREVLPFRLTESQEVALSQILGDLSAPVRMHRLLQGDVGSGKTVVAMAAMLACVEAGFEAILMAPTQILADQHFATFSRFLEPLGVPVRLRTAARQVVSAPLFDRGPAVTIGTHALLYEEEGWDGTGLVVIDEQHKFGVLQRARLIDMPDGPDALVMSATPIPRTLAQTLYGDLEISTLYSKPAGRGQIVTGVRDAKKLPEAAAFLKKHLDAGRQAYIVYALIDESEKLPAKAARAEVEKWRELLSPHGVGLLHGRTRPEEREETMAAFRDGRLPVLVATTVIEVGVDVPNATLLIVENAERFGLAQLHQLRGRIGRGTDRSYCILLHSASDGDPALERLAILEKTSDGFEIAEADLGFRGPGNVLGTVQAGFPPLRLPHHALAPATIERATRLAEECLDSDPMLKNHPPLRRHVDALLGKSGSAIG